jgi:F420H(2)-dependent quinone reductase
MRRSSPLLTRAHAAAIRLSGGRVRRCFLFTGGMPSLVLGGAQVGQEPLDSGGLPPPRGRLCGAGPNAGSDRSPAWWLNLQADPNAEILADRTVSP